MADAPAGQPQPLANAEYWLRNCLTCEYFNEANVWCSRHKGTPPPRIVVFGCPEYMQAPPF